MKSSMVVFPQYLLTEKNFEVKLHFKKFAAMVQHFNFYYVLTPELEGEHE